LSGWGIGKNKKIWRGNLKIRFFKKSLSFDLFWAKQKMIKWKWFFEKTYFCISIWKLHISFSREFRRHFFTDAWWEWKGFSRMSTKNHKIFHSMFDFVKYWKNDLKVFDNISRSVLSSIIKHIFH
jgi:hypothetical protein